MNRSATASATHITIIMFGNFVNHFHGGNTLCHQECDTTLHWLELHLVV